MKIAITADVHLRTRDETPERYGALEFILRDAAAEGIDTAIIAGDLFDEDFQNYAAFEALCGEHTGVSLHIIPGNHDPGISGQAIVASNARIYTETTAVDFGSTRVLFVPYRDGARMGEEIAGQVDAVAGTPWALVAHGDYYGGVRQANPLEPGTYMPLSRQDVGRFRSRQVFLGHIHKPADFGNVHYAGSPCGLDISETGIRRYLVFDTESGTVTPRAVDTDVIYFREQFVIVPMDNEADALETQIGERIASWGIDPADYPKVRIRAEAVGYAMDRRAIQTTLERGFQGFQTYGAEGVRIEDLSSSTDRQRAAIATRTLALIEAMEGISGGDAPDRQQVVIQALQTIYGA